MACSLLVALAYAKVTTTAWCEPATLDPCMWMMAAACQAAFTEAARARGSQPARVCAETCTRCAAVRLSLIHI